MSLPCLARPRCPAERTGRLPGGSEKDHRLRHHVVTRHLDLATSPLSDPTSNDVVTQTLNRVHLGGSTQTLEALTEESLMWHPLAWHVTTSPMNPETWRHRREPDRPPRSRDENRQAPDPVVSNAPDPQTASRLDVELIRVLYGAIAEHSNCGRCGRALRRGMDVDFTKPPLIGTRWSVLVTVGCRSFWRHQNSAVVSLAPEGHLRLTPIVVG